MKTKLQTVHDRVTQKRVEYERLRDKAHAETNYSMATCYEQMAVGLLIAEGVFLQFNKEERHAKSAKRKSKQEVVTPEALSESVGDNCPNFPACQCTKFRDCWN